LRVFGVKGGKQIQVRPVGPRGQATARKKVPIRRGGTWGPFFMSTEVHRMGIDDRKKTEEEGEERKNVIQSQKKETTAQRSKVYKLGDRQWEGPGAIKQDWVQTGEKKHQI